LGAGGVAGFGESSTISPIQIVRYRLGNLAANAGFAGLYTGSVHAGTAVKYDLIRENLDLTMNAVANSQELIAEYVVDLKFAFSVDSGTLNTPSLLTFAFGDALNQTWAAAPAATPSTPGPQRIRSVRVRLATRTALPDRSLNLPPETLAGTTDSQSFRYRYCLNSSGCGTTRAPQWARVRTLTTEVAIPNQMGIFY
jgi:hypothetical protein